MASVNRLRFVLASASPARLSLLQAAGLDPEVVVSGVAEDDESMPPDELAIALAVRKARAVMAELPADPDSTLLVLGCDSVLELDGLAHGKPCDADEAIARWRQMRGATGILHTGHCLLARNNVSAPGEVVEYSQLDSTVVRFGTPSDDEIRTYVATGEPLRVAGAFTLDRLGGWFVDGIDGDPGTVLGVSLPVVRSLLLKCGVSVPQLWAASSVQG